jgi:hypothetical protein
MFYRAVCSARDASVLRRSAKGRTMIDVSDSKIRWGKAAVLQHRTSSTERVLWVGERLYDGTVGGAVRFFKSLPNAKQERIEMFVDRGVIEGLEEDTIIGADVLRVLADRSDLPQ